MSNIALFDRLRKKINTEIFFITETKCANIFKNMFFISVQNMVLIGVAVEELHAIWSKVPIWGYWGGSGKG